MHILVLNSGSSSLPDLNAAHVGGRKAPVATAGSRLGAYVIPTNEELLIARDTARCVRGAPVPG